MIGEIRAALTPFYNQVSKRMEYKGRPVLILAQADADDYIVLPVSRITKKANRDLTYDIEIDPAIYPKLNLTSVSYVRTHKQTVIHANSIGKKYGDLKTEYEELFLEILEKRERFSNEITKQAL